jgi:uncharacterized protein DUF3558
MSIRGAKVLLALAGVLVLAGVTGCGAPAPPSAAPPPATPAHPALPPRPAELRLDGVDACTLLTDDQKRQFNIASGSSVVNDSGPRHGSICLWTTYAFHPDNHWTGGTDLNLGADYALGLEPLRSVDGFAATTTTSLGSDPNYYCAVLVDVAPGQALGADYSNESHDVPGMNRKVACDNAMRLASAMLATLRKIERR